MIGEIITLRSGPVASARNVRAHNVHCAACQRGEGCVVRIRCRYKKSADRREERQVGRRLSCESQKFGREAKPKQSNISLAPGQLRRWILGRAPT